MEPIDKVLHEPVDCLDSRHKAEHEGYEYTRRYLCAGPGSCCFSRRGRSEPIS